MKNQKYSFKVTGVERKVVAQIIAKAINQAATYAGPPSFAFEIGSISIDRAGIVSAPVDDAIGNILTTLSESGVVTEGIFSIPMQDHTGISLCNLANIISSKEKLLNKALCRSDEIIPRVTIDEINSIRLEKVADFVLAIKDMSTGGLSFDFNNKIINFGFFNSSIDIDNIKAYAALCTALDEQAKKQKYTSFLQKDVDNEKYAFRCFLLRLGFIGDEFKKERKTLMMNMTGNGSYAKNQENLGGIHG